LQASEDVSRAGTPWLMECGKDPKPLIVHFQTRPDPLAD